MSDSIFEHTTSTWSDATYATGPGFSTAPAAIRTRATGTVLPAPRACAATIHTSTTIASAHDAALLAILEAPLLPGEPALVGFARKEHELGSAFAALPVFDQRALHARLSRVRATDTFAVKFGRLTPDRRGRLINFLGDARRRAAQAAAKDR